MPSGKAKNKAKSKQEQAIHQDEDDLAMSEEEMYRIIRETGIMGQNSTASRESDAGFVTMRASELPEARFEELAEDTNDDEFGEDPDEGEVAATGLSANVPAPRKLVQLIDQDEGLPLPPRDFTEAAAEGGNTVITLADIEDDETFKTILWMVVFSTLWLCLDLMIHAQYGQDRGFREELGRAVNTLPALGFVIFFTAKYPTSYLTRAFLFAWSAVGGSYMIHIVNKAGYTQVMRRCPMLGSIWIWSIVQLDLPSALVSLAVVVAYVKYNGLSVIFPS